MAQIHHGDGVITVFAFHSTGVTQAIKETADVVRRLESQGKKIDGLSYDEDGSNGHEFVIYFSERD